MYSWLVTVLLLASAACCSGGARVPITSYTCTQPERSAQTNQHQCTVSSGLQTCKTMKGASPDGSITIGGTYGWHGRTNPFMVLDIPCGWCVDSVKMTFANSGSIPALRLSVHSAEHLSNNTDRTLFSIKVVSGTSSKVVMQLTALACGRYVRINMTSTGQISLEGFEVLGTNDSICKCPLPTSLNIYKHPSSAGGNSLSPTTSVGSSTHSVTPIRTSVNSATGPSSTSSQSPTTYAVVSTPVSMHPSTITTGESSLIHLPMSTSLPGPPTHNARSTDTMGCSTGISSAVFFAGLLVGAALAGPAGALSVACYHWKKKRAKTRGKDSTTSEDEEPAYDCPVKLEDNPAYLAKSFFKTSIYESKS